MKKNKIENENYFKQLDRVKEEILSELSRSGVCQKDISKLEKNIAGLENLPSSLTLPVLAPYLVNEEIANGIKSLFLYSFDVDAKESRKYIAELRQCYENFKEGEHKFQVACCFSKIAKKKDFDWLFEYSKDREFPGTRIEILSILAKFDADRIIPIYEEIALEGSTTSHLAEYELKKLKRKKRSKAKAKISTGSKDFDFSEEPGFSSSIDLENVELLLNRLGNSFKGLNELIPEIVVLVEGIDEREAESFGVQLKFQGEKYELTFLFESEDAESFGISIWGKEKAIEEVNEVFCTLMEELGI